MLKITLAATLSVALAGWGIFSWVDLCKRESGALVLAMETGAPRGQVISVLGQPHDTHTNERVEYMTYSMFKSPVHIRRHDYHVKLVDGKVQSVWGD